MSVTRATDKFFFLSSKTHSSTRRPAESVAAQRHMQLESPLTPALPRLFPLTLPTHRDIGIRWNG